MTKKILISFIFTILFFIPIATTNATPFSVCSGTTGCVKCAPNTSDPDVCQLESQGVSPGVGCTAGATAPSGAAETCSAIQNDPGTCNANYIACVGNTVPNGGFFCNTSGTFPSCSQCDNDPNTSIPACPGGAAAPYSNESTCHPNCDQVTGNFTCVPSGGTCKTSCGGGEQQLSGATCQTGICCRPNTASSGGASSDAAKAVQGNCPESSVDTAIGCIPFGSVTDLSAFFLKWGLGVSGGIAILMLVYASFQIMTSAGDPKRLQTGRELLMSAVSGIIIIVFSVFILKLLGITILGIF